MCMWLPQRYNDKHGRLRGRDEKRRGIALGKVQVQAHIIYTRERRSTAEA